MKKLYILFFTILISSLSFGQTVFINEIHYDNAGTDVDEGVEIAGPAGTDLTNYTLTFYNGSNNASYGTLALSGTIPNEGGNGYGAIWFSYSAGIQNGSPDGIALDNGGSLIQFLSYEGSMTGSGGVADGVLSEDIGVVEGSATPIGNSLQLTGSGADYINFSWAAEISATMGLINSGQTFGTPVPSLYLVDGPASGSTVEVGPEDLAGDLQFGTTNFVVDTPSAGDGYISWSIINVSDGGTVHASGDIYDTSQTFPFTALDPFKTYTLNAELFDNSGASLSTPVVYSITLNTLDYIVVSDIAALRAHVTANGAGSYYEITGASLVTHIDSYINRHWVQDTNISGVLLYDSQGLMSTYQVGDNVTGLKGVTEISSSGLLRFIPSIDSGVVASSGNTVTPQIVTIPDFNTNYENYESELVKLENVTFDAGDGVATFSTGSNYDVSSDAGANIVVMRTDFFGADYIGEIIPSTQLPSLTAVAGRFNTTAQIYARSLADITLDTKFNQIDGFGVYPNPTSLGYVTLSSKNNANMSVAVFDILGKQVLNKTVNNNTLDVSGLTSGIYIMKVSQENAISTKKLVIQ